MTTPYNPVNQSQGTLYPKFYYCDPGDIIRKLSLSGVQQRTQDYGFASEVGESGVLEEIVWDSSDIINYYCMSYYRPEDLRNSFWINRRATEIGVYLLEIRRGNVPTGSIATSYKQAIDWLEKIHMSHYEIPGVPVRFSQSPAWVNIRIDQRYATHRIRVERTISERSSVPYQQAIDFQSEYDYSI